MKTKICMLLLIGYSTLGFSQQYARLDSYTYNKYTGDQHINAERSLIMGGDAPYTDQFRMTYYQGNAWIDYSHEIFFRNINGPTGWEPIFHFTQTGNIGIGKMYPNAKLEVNGNIYAKGVKVDNGYSFLVGNEEDAGNRILMRLWDNQSYIDYYPEMMIRTGIDNKHFRCAMKFSSDGNIGLGGLENPQYPLDVRGTIRAHEVRVCLNQGCDYVFADDYKLMNLKDLSNFVKTNKHLPEVTPAAQMENDGINLSEMNALLLKKVEELTLYILQQEERIKALEAK